MSKQIQAIRGMRDILVEETPYWLKLEDFLRNVAESYGYQHIRLPYLEKTELFNRSIGIGTDIVEKEMYTFLDRNNESLTLRPEGTAVCVRAGIQHGLFYNQKQKYWYMGPMFRYERPQKDRYRQFEQFGIEVFGYSDPDIEVELILLGARVWKMLGIEGELKLYVNSLGSFEDRKHYREALIHYLNANWNDLDDDSQRRLNTNPLRILDSKNENMKEVIANAPKILEYLSNESEKRFKYFCNTLKELDINFVISPTLVRGLDYYNDTVFEWITTALGAQGTLCAGGRYDTLVETLGGQKCPAFGFAMGLDRIVSLMKQSGKAHDLSAVDVYILSEGEKARIAGLKLAEDLHDRFDDLSIVTYIGQGNFAKQFKEANKRQAKLAIIIGEEELNSSSASVKHLLETKEQKMYPLENILDVVRKELGRKRLMSGLRNY